MCVGVSVLHVYIYEYVCVCVWFKPVPFVTTPSLYQVVLFGGGVCVCVSVCDYNIFLSFNDYFHIYMKFQISQSTPTWG